MVVFGVFCFLGLVVLAYIRLAPVSIDRWHVHPNVQKDRVLANGVQKRVAAGLLGLSRLDAIAQADPRTQRLAGSVEQGLITYVTRTRMIGFPDYTTVGQSGEDLFIHARSRFGRRDFGTNAERIGRWLEGLPLF
ncbi:MAG: DUF1499 domain-containing protein [Pseudopelagicola sp.]|nr:DUF1499 domain-containing protein [Pseudopelagicola sp.]